MLIFLNSSESDSRIIGSYSALKKKSSIGFCKLSSLEIGTRTGKFLAVLKRMMKMIEVTDR